MQAVYLHAGKRINKDLKADEFHVNLFAEKLQLGFEYVLIITTDTIDPTTVFI